jgi:hypothetical protein
MVIETLDPDRYSAYNTGSGSEMNTESKHCISRKFVPHVEILVRNL